MKTTLLILALFSLNAFGSECVLPDGKKLRVAKGVGSIVAGYGAFKQYVSIKEILNSVDMNGKTVYSLREFRKSGSEYRDIPKFEGGDKVTVVIELRGEAARTAYLGDLARRIQEQESLIRYYTKELAEGWTRENVQFEVQRWLSDDDLRFITENARPDQKKGMEEAKTVIKYLKGEMARVKKEKNPNITRQLKTHNLSIKDHRDFMAQINRLEEHGEAYEIKRIPVKRLKAHARNGLVLLGTALALGAVTAQDIAAGKLSCQRGLETEALR